MFNGFVATLSSEVLMIPVVIILFVAFIFLILFLRLFPVGLWMTAVFSGVILILGGVKNERENQRNPPGFGPYS